MVKIWRKRLHDFDHHDQDTIDEANEDDDDTISDLSAQWLWLWLC